MKRSARLAPIFAVLLLGLTPIIVGHPALAQDSTVESTLNSFAQGLSTCDCNALDACTTKPFHDRLEARLRPCTPGQLGSFRRITHTQVEPGLALGTILWTQPDGVLKTLDVVVKLEGSRWLIAGGPVP